MKSIILFLPIFLFANTFYPIATESFNLDRARLGKKMFFDIRLSPNRFSCDRCHNLYLNQSGTSDLNMYNLNAPTILNSARNYLFFYSGSVRNIKDQVKQSITSPVELGSSFDFMIDILNSNEQYINSFNKIYPDGITTKNIIDAFINYEKTLITIDSKFDQFLKSDDYSVFSSDELEGYKLFLKVGCVYCHNGINLGSNALGDSMSNESIKIPTLRNITKTAPYYKDGSENDLINVISTMAKIKSNFPLTKEQADKLQKFLKTLEGDLIDYE